MIEIQRIRVDNLENVEKIIGRRGRWLGSGIFGHVYAKSKDRVVKFVDPIQDKGYYIFIKEVLKLENKNPFFPKIYSVTILNEKVTGECMMVVEMERLRNLDTVIKGYSNRRSIIRFFENIDFPRELKKNYWCILEGDLGEAMELLCNLVKKERKSPKYHFESDIHSGNIMIRKSDGLPVVTDPFA